MKRLLVNCLLTLVSLTAILLLTEAAIRCWFAFHRDYDYEMWRYAAQLKEPLPAGASPPFHHKPSAVGTYYGVEIRTNREGFRGDELAPGTRQGRKRVVVLGDSFALGWGVPFAETVAMRLQGLLNGSGKGFEVVNMGVGNYNTAMEVDLFKLKGIRLQPDMVVLLYYINDSEPTPTIDGGGSTIFRHLYLPAYIATRVRQLGLRAASSDWLLAYYRKLYRPGAPGLERTRQALTELRQLCAERGIRLLVVNIPDLRRLDGYPFAFASEIPRTFAERNRLPYLDLLPVFAPYSGDRLWVSGEDPHMNGFANKIAARAIYEKMTSAGMLAGVKATAAP